MPLFFSSFFLSSHVPGNTTRWLYRMDPSSCNIIAIKLTRHTCNLTPPVMVNFPPSSPFIVASQHHIHPSAKQFDIKKFSIFFPVWIFNFQLSLLPCYFFSTFLVRVSRGWSSPPFRYISTSLRLEKMQSAAKWRCEKFSTSDFFSSPPVWTLEIKWAQDFVEGMTRKWFGGKFKEKCWNIQL